MAKEKRHTKVLKLRILKPAGDMTWNELGEMLRAARYRVFRLANLAVSEHYLRFHMWRCNKEGEFEPRKISALNRDLREMLEKEDKNDIDHNRFSNTGALPSAVVDALSWYKLKGVTTKSRWSEVVRGKSALPTYRLNMPIPVRCDKKEHRRLERSENGDVEVDLLICKKPYPRVVIPTGRGAIGDGQRAILERLLDGEGGYRQRCFEIKEDANSKKWHLYVTYDFPASDSPKLEKSRIVGADLGFACPLYAAINNGHARLGWRQFAAIAGAVRSLQNQTIRRRRQILRGGQTIISDETARSGHGRQRKLKPMRKLEGRIDRAYRTLNHRISAALIKFAINHGAGVIQIEDLNGLKDVMSGTFLGERWRYAELQNFIKYKADEAGIEVREVNPRYTSMRCSKCGHINIEFTREFRDTGHKKGFGKRFKCPACEYEADADYNAARNLATEDIADKIAAQAKKQELKTK